MTAISFVAHTIFPVSHAREFCVHSQAQVLKKKKTHHNSWCSAEAPADLKPGCLLSSVCCLVVRWFSLVAMSRGPCLTDETSPQLKVPICTSTRGQSVQSRRMRLLCKCAAVLSHRGRKIPWKIVPGEDVRFSSWTWRLKLLFAQSKGTSFAPASRERPLQNTKRREKCGCGRCHSEADTDADRAGSLSTDWLHNW